MAALSRVWPEKPGSTLWREEPGTAVPRGHFIGYLNHFHFLQIMKARGLYVFTEMGYHVIRVNSIKIRKYTNPANSHHPRRGPLSWDLSPVPAHTRTHALSEVKRDVQPLASCVLLCQALRHRTHLRPLFAVILR